MLAHRQIGKQEKHPVVAMSRHLLVLHEIQLLSLLLLLQQLLLLSCATIIITTTTIIIVIIVCSCPLSVISASTEGKSFRIVLCPIGMHSPLATRFLMREILFTTTAAAAAAAAALFIVCKSHCVRVCVGGGGRRAVVSICEIYAAG